MMTLLIGSFVAITGLFAGAVVAANLCRVWALAAPLKAAAASDTFQIYRKSAVSPQRYLPLGATIGADVVPFPVRKKTPVTLRAAA